MINKYNIFFILKIYFILFTDSLFSCRAFETNNQLNFLGNIFVPYQIETRIGPLNINSKFLHDIVSSQALRRMQFIDQGGPCAYFFIEPPYLRIDHCLGVAALVQKYGGSEFEVAVAVLHDVSHTVFSHIADLLYTNRFDSNNSYQDNIHTWYLSKTDINDICKKYFININKFDPDFGNYFMLEQSLPDMCADRIEYNLETAIIWNKLSNEDINYILNHLKYENKKWFFDDIYAAQIFSELPFFFMDNIWNNPLNKVFYKYFTEGLKRLLDLNLITFDTIHFGKDSDILQIMNKCNDKQTKHILECCKNIKETFVIGTNDDYSFYIKCKFRGIDPLIKINGNYVRLSQIDETFKKKYEFFKEKTEKGYFIKLLKPLLI
jgi:HD superfamily phosphohydrolase